ADLTLQGKGDVVLDVQDAVPAIALDGCTNIRLVGLHVVGGSANGIEISDSSDIALEKCRFENQQGDGLHVDASDGVSCSACQATLVTGVAFSFAKAPTDDPCNDVA